MATPPLTSSSTLSDVSTEEFPIHPSSSTGTAIPIQSSEPIGEISLGESKTRRFLLRSFVRPFAKAGKVSKGKETAKASEPSRPLKPARKSTEGHRDDRPARRVSFSPSIEEEMKARELTIRKTAEAAALVTDYGRENAKRRVGQGRQRGLTRRASFNDSIGRQSGLPSRRRTASFCLDEKGVYLAPGAGDEDESTTHSAGRLSRARVTRQQAIAARHARTLEQLINAGSSLSIESVEDLKAKRERKTHGKYDKSKVQMLPAVSPRKALALKQALLDSEMACNIIGQLRFLQLDPRSLSPPGSQTQNAGAAADLLQDIQKAHEEAQAKAKSVVPRPLRAICLDCTEEEAEKRQQAFLDSQTTVPSEKEAPVAAMTTVEGAATLWRLAGWFKAKEEATNAQVEMAMSSTLGSVPGGGVLTGVSPISLIVSPVQTVAMAGATQIGTFDTLGALSGLAVQAASGGAAGMQDVHPPLDRMAIFIHWWGFELTLPQPSMSYLGTAHSISGSFLTFLQTMVVTGGAPELLPFVRYVSSFVDMEFGAIKSQNRGNGVIIAATWLMPMALVPRPWDYPTNVNPGAKPSMPSSTKSMPFTTVPTLPARLSSKSSSPLSFHKVTSLSSRERHAQAGKDAGTASANDETPSPSHMINSPVNMLDSLKELPEGSVRMKR